MANLSNPELLKKWAPILEAESAPEIRDQYRRSVTAQMLENQEKAGQEEAALFEAAPANSVGSYPDAGGVAKFDPVLISLVRRAMPQLIAYDIVGVQPMTQPTGLVFAMKSRYTSQNGTEALYNEANSVFSGDQAGTQSSLANGSTTVTSGGGMTTSQGEGLPSGTGGTANEFFNQMAFSVEKVAVQARTRALKAEYSVELAQDLKALHGMDAEAELSKILSTEILAEINREVIRGVYSTAKVGAQNGTAAAGVFDLDIDSNGRWSVEKFKGLMFQIERDANVIAQQTRRGKGNFIICSSDVASALAMAGVLDYAPAISANLNVDESSTTFAGVLNGKFKVYVDPYASNASNEHFFTVGYKGSSAWDAGLFYCPYVPLQLARAQDPNTFQPKIAFKTRYGLIGNPFSDPTSVSNAGDLALLAGKNTYFRKVVVKNLL